MLVLSLTALIEQATAGPGKNLSGNVKDLNRLLQPESLAQLEKYQGVFAFLAFHAGVDAAVAEYIEMDTLASDSGAGILVFFTGDKSARLPQNLSGNGQNRWLTLDIDIHPAYQLIRLMFLPHQIPPLPGIVFFERFTENCDPVYISLSDTTDHSTVRQRIREICSLADYALRRNRNENSASFADLLAVDLQKKKLPYYRAGVTSVREWMVKAYQFVGEHKGDLISVLNPLG